MNVKTKINQLKRELLLQEASGYFETVGYEEMKVADLAKSAGVSITTIYGFFDSKEGLYLAYIEHQIDNFFAELQASVSDKTTAKEKIYNYIELKFTYYHQKRKAIEQSATNNPLFFNTLYTQHSNPFQKVHHYLSECFMELNPKLSAEQAMRMAFAINGFSDGYVSQWLELNDDLLDKVDEVSSLFTGMVEGCK